jgi:DNA-binding beta-propeller fold protein YncE
MVRFVIGVVAVALVSPALVAAESFTAFESGQVRPLALSPTGARLFAVNTPDNALEIFTVGAGGLTHVDSVPVGLEPVAVAARTDDEVWVVNHLSDSVSIVDVAASPPRVVRTLLIGDEPRDIVFAGPVDNGGAFTRAFITTARRGQNLPPSVPPLLTTPGVARALVWVFDATALGTALAGEPLGILELFGDTPRALAATADGSTVYAAVFQSGNQTTAINEGAVCNGGGAVGPCGVDGIQVPGGLPAAQVPGGLPAPNQNLAGAPGPEVGLIVRRNPLSGHWEDQLGRNWTNGVRFDLPDLDVFQIDADAPTPVQTAAVPHVGTVLFNMLVNPTTGKLYVTNTEARNEVRFEGPGGGGSTVRGHLHEARITVVDGTTALPRHLNKHITALPNGYHTAPMPAGVGDASLATPLGMALASDGTLYVSAFGSSAIGRFAASALEDDTFVPNAADHIAVSGGGPTGLALDEAHARLYVLTRFDNAVKVINTATQTETAQHPLHNPEPPVVRDGRPFLYDAQLTSSNGEASCSSCHVFGDFDSLGWDLGNPDDAVAPNNNPPGIIGGTQPFHPMKGPMTTQTLRGLATHGPMHWRGDRTGATFPGDPLGLDEQRAFEAFNVAFGGLLGRDAGPLPPASMTAFARFALAIRLPPNPIRALDNSLTPQQAAGQNTFFNAPATDGVAACVGCHVLDRAQGFFGSAGRATFENETQEFKVAPLRNAYQKVGMFGMPDVAFLNVPDPQHSGDQVRGFGFLHDGSVDTVRHFLHATVFSLTDTDRANLEQFIMAFDSDLAPVVGQQVTLTNSNAALAGPRLDLLLSRAQTSFVLLNSPGVQECDLVVHGTVGGEARGFRFDPSSGMYLSDRAAESPLSDAALRLQAATPGQALTYTCAPPGSGARMALDRDEDGFYDRDERDAGTDPADPGSYPGGPVDVHVALQLLQISNRLPDDEARNKVVIVAGGSDVATPAVGGPDDPRCGLSPPTTVRATLRVASNSSGQAHQTDLPCGNWRLLGSAAQPRGYRYRDPELDDGTVKLIVWKTGRRLKVVLQGKGPSTLDYDLQSGIPQGSVTAVLQSGATSLCGRCLGGAGVDGTDGRRFRGRNCAAPPACP